MLFVFEDFELDADQLELRRAGESCAVEPQVFAILELLVSNAHRVVSKEEINEQVWGGRIVSEAALSSRIRSARKAIGDNGKAQRLIKTIRDRGFRFVGEVVASGSPSVSLAPLSQRATDTLATDPTSLATAAGPTIETSTQQSKAGIAVLPLAMLGDDPRHAPLADAISHEVITELSRLHWLHVIARGSSFRFRGTEIDVRDVGRVLGVRYVLTGSLAIFGSATVVTLELADATDGSAIWADRMENELDDLLGLRTVISSQVATSIEGRIISAEASRAASLSTENLDSWSAYYRGLWHVYRFNAHDTEVAAHLFRKAIALDESFARAHSGLSFAHFQNAFVGYRTDRPEQLRRAREHADKSYELDPLDPFINLTMGRTQMLHNDWESATRWFERCTQMNPNYSLAYYHSALANAVAGDGETGPGHIVKAISLSPIDPLHYAMCTARGLSHMVQGDYAEARDWAERGALAPGAHVHIWAIAAMTHELAGDHSAAERWGDRVRDREPAYTKDRFFRSFPIHQDRARAIASEAFERLGF